MPWGAMAQDSSNSSQGGGFLIAAAVLIGAVGGVIAGQPSVGFVIGITVGVAGALLLWWRDRRR